VANAGCCARTPVKQGDARGTPGVVDDNLWESAATAPPMNLVMPIQGV